MDQLDPFLDPTYGLAREEDRSLTIHVRALEGVWETGTEPQIRISFRMHLRPHNASRSRPDERSLSSTAGPGVIDSRPEARILGSHPFSTGFEILRGAPHLVRDQSVQQSGCIRCRFYCFPRSFAFEPLC